MRFDFDTKEQELSRQTSGALRKIAGWAEKHEEDREKSSELLREVLKRLGRTSYPEAHYDEGAVSPVALLAAIVGMTDDSPSIALGIESSLGLLGRAIALFGNPWQRERWLGPISRGEMLGALALSEGTMNDQMVTKAEDLASGREVVLSGKKDFVINAPVADLIGVVGLYGGEEVIFLVEPGVARDGLVMGPTQVVMGYEGMAVSSMTMERLKMSKEHILKSERSNLVETIRRWEDLIYTGVSLGLTSRALQVITDQIKLDRSKRRRVETSQELSFKLAEMYTLFEASQLLAYRAAWETDAGSHDDEALLRCAKVFCSESAEKVASEALQILSIAGIVETPNRVERAYRAAKLTQMAGTSVETARRQIGDDALKRLT